MESMKRVVSLLLCLVMVVGLLPMAVFATEGSVVEESAVATEGTTVLSEEQTEAPAEEVTQEATAAPTEAETQAPTEEATEAETEAPTEEATEVPSEEATEAPTEEVTYPVAALADGAESNSVTIEDATGSETREVYVLVSSISAAGDYLIVSANSATTSANMLTASSNGVTNTANVTVTTAANAAGTNVTYIENPTANAVWTVSSSDSGWRLYNAGTERYLRYSNGLGTTSQQNSATTWTSGTNTLYYNSNTDRYVRYNNNNWGTSNNSATVYIYQKQSVAFPVEINGTYTIAGKDVEKVVVAGSTATLSSTLTFVPTSGSAKTTDVSTTATYTVSSDPNGIVSGITGNTLTFSGTTGEAEVKVTYTMTIGGTEYTLTDYITVTAKDPTYTVEITRDDVVVTEVLTVKSVTDTTTLQLGQLVTYETAEGVQTLQPGADNIAWTSSNTAIATVDDNGLLSFTGATGKFNVTVTFTVDGKEITDIITVSASTSQYFVPEDGTSDFPEYPNEGAVRIDKTAQAVGNFSQTGVAKVELSMTGVPYSAGNEIDVIIMIDMSTSMKQSTNGVADRVTPARNAANSALEAIVKNEDGTINNNRVAVYTFNGYDQNSTTQNYANAVDEVLSMQSYQNADDATDTSNLTEAQSDITSWIIESNTGSGTNYGAALEKCYSVLQDAKEEYPDRKQYVIFVTDGEPTTGFAYETEDGGVADDGYNSQYSDGAADKYYTYTEYYSKQMRAAGVEVYSVGIQLDNTNANTILKKIGGNSTGTAYANADTHADYAQFIDADESADKLIEIFENIVNATKEAATDVTVTDKVADTYTMILQAPNTTVAGALPADTEFAIEVLQYTLDENKNRTGTPTVVETVTLDDTDKVTLNADGSIASINATYFTYDAATHIITWNADKLDTKELALSYYVYLNESAGYDVDEQTPAGTYPTNDYAHITYTNHLDHECQKYFPKPQLTWNGAQVNYTFYLVNSQGQPVNRAGRVVPFAEAVYVTDVYTQSITWDTYEGDVFSANMIAEELLPDVYSLYDPSTSYTINVYEDETGTDQGNSFTIVGGNTTANADTYTTKVFNTKAGTIFSVPGTYTADDVYTGFDFANTTVAFAVVWQNELAADTVVIDFGLDVVVDVTTNDALEAKVVGVRTAAPAGVAINSGNYTAAEAAEAQVKLGNLVVGTASVENQTSVRFSLDKNNGMQISEPAVFYYESEASYYDAANVLTTTDLYSSVTVIPATTIYYEDDFVTYKSYDVANEAWLTNSTWTTEGTRVDADQAQDRPGENKLVESLDADNIYGYDGAYTAMSQFSMGSAAKVNVSAATSAAASFTFYGTGFDVVSMTSNATGTIIVDVYQGTPDVYADTITATRVRSLVVDTYYGYVQNADGEWVISPNTPNAVYQVPVIKVSGLEYGQYTVRVSALYNEMFDHNGTGSYDFYLDAIRVYDPTGNENDVANNAYVADGEGWPVYQELRNNIISATDYEIETTKDDMGTVIVTIKGEDTLPGAVFIDCADSTSVVADYVSYGPNNELYLANNQAIAFNVTVPANMADVQLGIKAANGAPVTFEINGDSYTVETATDLYYSIKDYVGETITIKNVSGGILSLTNIKVTHTSAPAETETASLLWIDETTAAAAVMSLRAPVVDEPEVEETEPETTEPETEATEPETEPETTEPETEATEPETTEPEVTEPETEPAPETSPVVDTVIRIIRKLFGWLFG